jgi:hypothetical protein
VVSGQSGKDLTPGATGLLPGKWADDTLQTSMLFGGSNGVRLRWYVNAVNDAGTAGAFYQLRLNEYGGKADYGYAWWNPIKQFKLQLGKVDAFRPFDVLWGLNINDVANTAGVGGAGDDMFWGIQLDHGAAIQLKPIDGLEIAVGANITGADASGKTSGQEAYDAYARTSAYVGYTINGIGTVALGFNGNGGFPSSSIISDPDSYGTYGDPYYSPRLAFGFNLTAVENLKAQLGVQIPFASKGGGIKSATSPYKIAIGANFTSADTFGVLAHLKTTFGTKIEVEDVTALAGSTGGTYYEGPFYFGIGLSPWYNLGIGKVGLDVQLAFSGASKTYRSVGTAAPDLVSDYNEYMLWEVTPYFEKNIGGGSFLIGFKLGAKNYTNGDFGDDGNGKIYWAVPVGLLYYF